MFRNLFPAEYSKLEEKSGVLPILLNKRNLSNVLLQKINNEINNLESLIQSANNEYFTNFDELKLMLKGVFVKSGYRSGSSLIRIDSLTSLENLDFNRLEHPFYYGCAVNISEQDLDIISSVNFEKREKKYKDQS